MHVDEDRPPPDVERMLRECRPVPDTTFTASTERRLFARVRLVRRLPTLAMRPLVAGSLLAVAMASLVLVLSFAGLGPLALDGGSDVKGSSNCTYVTVHRRVSVPTLVAGRNGEPVFVHRERSVARRVKRCG